MRIGHIASFPIPSFTRFTPTPDSSVDVFVSDFRQVTGIALVEAGLPCSDDSALAIATSMSAVSASFTLDSDLYVLFTSG